MPDNTIKILLFLAQGFEDLEAVTILDVYGTFNGFKNKSRSA